MLSPMHAVGILFVMEVICSSLTKMVYYLSKKFINAYFIPKYMYTCTINNTVAMQNIAILL